MARLEVFCSPRVAAVARTAAGAAGSTRWQGAAGLRACARGGESAAVPTEELAGIAATVWRKSQAGPPRVAELRLQLGTGAGEDVQAAVLRGRLRLATDPAPAVLRVAVNEQGALLGMAASLPAVYNALLRLLEGFKIDDARRARGIAHLRLRELSRLEYLMVPLIPVLETDEYKRMDITHTVTALCSFSERMRTKFVAHAPGGSAHQSPGSAVAEPLVAKVAVLAVHKEALNMELRSQRYMVVKERLLKCHREAGEFVAQTMLDMAITGEHADGETFRSPPLLQIAWGTFQADAVDAEIAFLSEYADQDWPTALARAVCEH
eukprot:6181261-Pleurochrysis_carterae.AAC.1